MLITIWLSKDKKKMALKFLNPDGKSATAELNKWEAQALGEGLEENFKEMKD